MKTIDYPVMTEKKSIRNVVHLNQTQGNPLTIKPLRNKFGYDVFLLLRTTCSLEQQNYHHYK